MWIDVFTIYLFIHSFIHQVIAGYLVAICDYLYFHNIYIVIVIKVNLEMRKKSRKMHIQCIQILCYVL